MAKYIFLQLLGTLSPRELSGFGRHLRASNSRKKVVVQVFDYCKRHYPSLDFDVDATARKLFPNKSATLPPRKALLNAFSELHSILKNFLLLEKLADGSLESRLIWLHVQKKRGLKEEAVVEADKLFEEIRNMSKSEEADYLNHMLVEFATVDGLIEAKPPSDESLANYEKALNDFYEIAQLKLSCEKISRMKLKGEVRHLSVAQQEKGKGSLHQLYAKVQKLLLSDDEKEFDGLEEQLTNYASQITRKELFAICAYLRNHCTKKFREGYKEYGMRAHKINMFGLAEQIYFTGDGHMPFDSYFNIISVANAVGQHSWAEDFAKKYKTKLAEANRYEAWMLANAIIFYEKKEYDKALKKLRALDGQKPSLPQVAIRGKLLKVACLAGIDLKSDQLLAEIINVGSYLKRSSQNRSGATVASQNFLHIVYLMAKGKKTVDQIEKEIEAAKDSLQYESWLLEMLKAYRPS